MRKILFAALAAVVMTACTQFKTEATVDIKVMQKGQPLSGVTVYKFPADRSTQYKENNTGSAVSNAGGVAHFDIKSPDDLDPSNIAGIENENEATFFFCTFDKNGDRNAMVEVRVKTGGGNYQKTLEVPEEPVNGGDE